MDIVDVISGYTRLKKVDPGNGSKAAKGLQSDVCAPFVSEKTPSFTVDAAKGLWHCFWIAVCRGDVYQFIQKVERIVPFPESVEWLAATTTGYQLRYEEMRPGRGAARGQASQIFLPQSSRPTRRLPIRFNLAPDRALVELGVVLEDRSYGRPADTSRPVGLPVRYEASHRGGSLATLEPGREQRCAVGRVLVEANLRLVVSEQELQQEGILPAVPRAASSRRRRLYDTFRERIIFPTWRPSAKLAGGRGSAHGCPRKDAQTPIGEEEDSHLGDFRAVVLGRASFKVVAVSVSKRSSRG